MKCLQLLQHTLATRKLVYCPERSHRPTWTASGPVTSIPSPEMCRANRPGNLEAAPYLHTSLPLENMEARMTSGAIQAYVPAALILVVRCHSRASPKSVIFRILLLRSPFSTFCRINTERRRQHRRNQISISHRASHPPPSPVGTATVH